MRVIFRFYKGLLNQAIWLLCAVLILTNDLVGQSNEAVLQKRLGLNPPSLKWKKIDTDAALIIYPDEAEPLAQRVAALLLAINERDNSSIGGSAQKVPIILHTNSTIPGAVPFIGPWKSDWITTPSQLFFAGPIEWMDLLTIHEYRHHQQMTRAKHGWFAGFLRATLGQTGWFVSVLVVQPTWFFEGDATYAETMLSNAGRGRTPSFDRDYKAIRLSGRHYDYEKANRNSKKDFVPNVYREGYYMVSYARKHFGNDIWEMVLEDTYQRKGLFYPFSRSFKKYTGLTVKQLYGATMKELDSMWLAEEKQLVLTASTLRSIEPNRVFTSYRFPHYIGNGTIVTEKSAFNEIKTYYMIDKDGKEEKMFSPGFITEDHVNMSLVGNLMTWSENTFHERWRFKDYAVIKTYNLTTKEKKKITSKSRYVSPSPSYDGKMIVAVELKKDGSHDLVVLNAKSGELMNVLPNPDQCFFSFPRWKDDGSGIVVTVTNKNGNAIRLYDALDSSFEDLIPFNDNLITRTFANGNYVYFSGAHTGVDNIFALNLKDKSLYQVTSTKFGAYDPSTSTDGTHLLFSEFTADGFELKEMKVDPKQWKKHDASQPSSLHYFKPLVEQEGGNILEGIKDTTFVTNQFKPFFKSPINIHSWNPIVEDPNYGLNLTSDNIMSTIAANGSVQYNSNERSWKTTGTISYGGLYPIFDIGFSHGARNSELIYGESNMQYSGKWRENIIFGGIGFPFNLSSGTYMTKMELGSSYQHRDILFKDHFTDPSRNGSFGSISIKYGFARLQRGARQFAAPRLGQTMNMFYDKTINGSQNKGSRFQVNGNLYFPGLFKNHSIVASGSYKRESITNSYRFEDIFSPSRGYNSDIFVGDRFDSNAFDDIYKISFDYVFPLGFPDLSIGSVAYFRGINASLFYDYSKAIHNREETLMRSAGIDISIDVPLLRIIRPELIIRLVNRFDIPEDNASGNFNVEFAFNVVDLEF